MNYSTSELREIFGRQVWESGDGMEVNVQCPYCVGRGRRSPDTSGHLGLNFVKGVGHCVRCGWSTKRLGRFLRERGYSGRVSDATGGTVSWAEAMLGRVSAARDVQEPEFDVQDLEPSPHWVPVRKAPPDYLASLVNKGITADICERWGVMSCIETDAERGDREGYNIFPFTEFGDLCYWQGRAVWKGLIRKHSPPLALGAGAWLYNYPDDRATTAGRIGIVTEGTLDCISSGECMAGDARECDFWPVSIQGTSLTFPSDTRHRLNSQLGKLKSMNLSMVLLLLDPEERGKARTLAQKMSDHGLATKVATYPNGTDPNKLFQIDPDALRRVILHAALGVGRPTMARRTLPTTSTTNTNTTTDNVTIPARFPAPVPKHTTTN